MSEPSWNRRSHRRRDLDDVDTRSTSAASARKLVGALWQLSKGGGGAFGEEEVGWDARRSSDHRRSASVEFSKMSRRKSEKALKDDEERSWHNGHAHGQWFQDVLSNGGTAEVHTCPPGLSSPYPVDGMAQLQELYNSLTASNELVRVLANVLGPAGGLNPTAASLLAALRSELDVARARARRLVRERRRRGEDDAPAAEHLREQLAEEMRAWKSRHREKAAAYARLAASELDGERRSRRRAERASKKLGEALAEAEASLRAATRELEREKAARETLEKVCDELAGGGAAAAAEEELRREAAESAAREELEREREMLRLADELREERVRMKLAEARLQFEEKNAVVDRLRQELEAFLGTADKNRQESPAHEHHRVVVVDDDDYRLQLALASEFSVDGIDRVAVVDKNGGGDDCGEADDDSDGSDIELNMDGNSWSYSTTTAKNAASRSSRHGSFSDRGMGCGAGGFDRSSEGMGDDEEAEGEWDEACSDNERTTTTKDEDAERYEAIKNLREQMLAGHGFVFLSSQGGDDAERDHHRHGLICQIEGGGLW